MRKVKILFVTPVLGHPAVGGPKLRIENSIKALSKVSELYLYSRAPLSNVGGKKCLAFYAKYVKGFYFSPLIKAVNPIYSLLKNLADYIPRMLLKVNIDWLPASAERNFKDILRTADDLKAELIWLGYGNISYPLLKYIKKNSDYKVVLDTDSVWSRFVLRGLPYAKSDAERKRIAADGHAKEIEEEWGTRLADVTTAVSIIDMDYYQGFVNDKDKVKVFSNVIDTDNYREKPVNMDMKRPSVYLAGTFWNGSPMQEAALWMIEKVMPAVWSEYPELHFYILGIGSKETLAEIQDDRISILGMVDSVLPYLCNVDIVVVPLKFESGTRFKILEAAACGVPIVSTTLGAEGIPVTHNENIMIADTPSDFADSIIYLLKNREKAQELADNCRELVSRDYGIANAASEAEKIIEHVMNRDNIR